MTAGCFVAIFVAFVAGLGVGVIVLAMMALAREAPPPSERVR